VTPPAFIRPITKPVIHVAVGITAHARAGHARQGSSCMIARPEPMRSQPADARRSRRCLRMLG
jgi:hypothetical protein